MTEPYKKPLPTITPLNRPFWEYAQQKKLAIQTCMNCGDRHHPPSPSCPNCLHPEQRWDVVSGRGILETWVEFHRAYWPGFLLDLPYQACLVRLEEGPLLISNLVGKIDTARVGAPVRVIFEEVTPTITLHRFELAPG